MPLEYQIYADAETMVVRGKGVITQAERVATMLAWLADPAYQNCIDALCDFSQAESAPSRADLHELIALLGTHRPVRGPKKVAIIAQQIITLGIARVFEDMVDLGPVPLAFKAFADREHAWAWLRPGAPPLIETSISDVNRRP
jgi:hypothetical protein